SLSISTTEDLHAVYFIDEATGFVAGDVHAFKTVDGGNNWSEMALPGGHSFRDLLFLNSQTGFCLGGNGLIFKTTNGGANWEPKTPNTLRTMSNIHFPTPQTGYAVSTGYGWEYLKTTDGGETWISVPINTPSPNTSNLEAIFFTAADKGFIGGWYLSALVTTADGGNNWALLEETTSPQLYAIDFPTEAKGYAVGWNGQIFSTTDGGSTWELQIYANEGIFYAVQFTDENTGYIAGYDGLILKTGNGGVTSQTETDTAPFSVRAFPNPTDGAVSLDLSAYANHRVRLEVYDLQGRRLKVQEAGETTIGAVPLDLSAFPNGVYHIRILSEGVPDVVIRGIIIQH
ncbi:MAG: T9SS type A sorting domain-containing protein, partial [Saprospiraceae bacterium]|nr:T9SS type A sorting domain-containing protein [Saprospiraceae bacterium]